MRILYYIPGPTYGGAHNQVVRLSGPLADAGYESVVLLPDQEGDAYERLVAAGIETYRHRLHRLRATRDLRTHGDMVAAYPSQIRYLAEFLTERRIDMVQLHGVTSVDGALAARRRRIPVVWQILDTRAPLALRVMTAPLVRSYADSVLVTGRTVGDQYPGLAVLGERLVPYYPPVSASEFTPPSAADRAAVRAELGVADDEVLIGDLGNLNSQKGHQYVVEAVGRVRGTLPAVTLRVRGGSATGHEAYQQRVEDLARESGLPPNTVRSLEPGMSPARFLSALDVFALGSEPRSEGVPTAIIESMLTGVPTVAARVGGVNEVVRDGETGWCVAPRDVAAMTDRLRQLAADPALRHRLGEQARTYAAAHLSLDNCVQAHLNAYEAARGHAALRTAPKR